MDSVPEWLREEPFAWALESSQLKLHCSFCLRRKGDEEEGGGRTLFRCTNCNRVYYCSVDCQRRDWVDHKTECRRLQNVDLQRRAGQLDESLTEQYPDDMVRLVARLVQKLLSSESGDQKSLPSSGNRTWKDLEYRIKDLKDSDTQYEQYQLFCDRYATFVGRNPWRLHQKRMELVYSKVRTNYFAINDGTMQQIGIGLYLSLSRVGHSCDPNARLAFNGKRCSIVPVHSSRFENTQELEWSHVKVTRINNLLPKRERQAILRELFCIEECSCNGCQNDDRNHSMIALACPDHSCTGKCINQEPNENEPPVYVCDRCSRRADARDLSLVNEAAELASRAFSASVDPKTPSATKYELATSAAAAVDRTFYRYSTFRMKLHYLAYDLAIGEATRVKKKLRQAVWEKAAAYATEVLEGYNYYLGEYDPCRLAFAAQVAGTRLHAGDQEGAMELLFNSHKKYEHVYGKDSDGMQTILKLIKSANLT